MTLIAISYLAGFLCLVAPTRLSFLGCGLIATLLYLYTSNIPSAFFGVDDFVRYSKEPIILAFLIRCAVDRKKMRAAYEDLKERGGREIERLYAVVFIKRKSDLCFNFLLVWSLVSFLLMGIDGFLGYIRGVLFPLAVLEYLLKINNRSARLIGAWVGILSNLLIVFLALSAYAHFNIDASFLISDLFKNRLDVHAPYQTIVQYGSVSRYQSFFGDPNRAALVFIIFLWLSKGWGGRVGHFIICALSAILIWVTESRTGMALGLIIIVYKIFKGSGLKIGTVFAFAALLSFGALIYVWSSYSTRSGSEEDVGRDLIWKGVVSRLIGSPKVLLIGEGFGWVGQSGSKRAEVDDVQLTSSSGKELSLNVIDNSYLTLVSSIGVVGIIPFFVFCINSVRQLLIRSGSVSARADLCIFVAILLMWAFNFDAFVSFPWTFLFPLIIRISSSRLY